MKIVLAPDKFKNSLTGMTFCDVVEASIKTIHTGIEIVKLPLADGGDGTIDVVDYYLKGDIIHIEVNNPFFQKINNQKIKISRNRFRISFLKTNK